MSNPTKPSTSRQTTDRLRILAGTDVSGWLSHGYGTVSATILITGLPILAHRFAYICR